MSSAEVGDMTPGTMNIGKDVLDGARNVAGLIALQLLANGLGMEQHRREGVDRLGSGPAQITRVGRRRIIGSGRKQPLPHRIAIPLEGDMQAGQRLLRIALKAHAHAAADRQSRTPAHHLLDLAILARAECLGDAVLDELGLMGFQHIRGTPKSLPARARHDYRCHRPYPRRAPTC